MAGLLDFLFGGSNAPAQAPTSQWGYDQSGYLTRVPNGAGVTPPQSAPQPNVSFQPPAAPAPGAMVQQAAQSSPAMPLVSAATNPPQAAPSGTTDPNAIQIDGDSWKPKHASVLGQIADYFLGTHFGRNTVRQNEEGALQHLTSNPMEAVRRMAEFDPTGAQALYSQVMREQHQGAMEKHQSDVYSNMAENQAMSVARNMASTATPENQGAVQAQISKYLQAKGVSQSLIDTIPDANGSLDDFKTFAQGGVPAGRQAALVEQVRNHDMEHGDRQANLGERANFHSQLLPILRQNAGTSAGRLDESISHDTTMEGQGQEKIDTKEPGRRFIQTQYGTGAISKDGMVMSITPNDPRLDQTHMQTDPKTKKTYIMYDNVGTAQNPKWKLRH